MRKIYFDSEFTGLHRDTTLISIGLISESGNTFYAEFTDYQQVQVDEWISNNVIKNLRFATPNVDSKTNHYRCDEADGKRNVEMTGDKSTIRLELLRWLYIESGNDQPDLLSTNVDNSNVEKLQFMVDCYAYDWMLLVDLITTGGSAIDMPDYIHYIPIDLSSVLWKLNVDPDISREEFASSVMATGDYERDYHKHNSLFDAIIIKACFERCNSVKLVLSSKNQ